MQIVWFLREKILNNGYEKDSKEPKESNWTMEGWYKIRPLDKKKEEFSSSAPVSALLKSSFKQEQHWSNSSTVIIPAVVEN